MVYGIIGMINFCPRRGVHDLRLPVGYRPCPCWPSSAQQNFLLLILGTLLFTVLVTCTHGWVIEGIA